MQPGILNWIPLLQRMFIRTISKTRMGSQDQFSHSVVSDSATPWTTACQASLSITNSWNLLKLMSIGLVMPSKHLILCHPLILSPSIFASIRVFSDESALRMRWPKYWSFSFNISPSNDTQNWSPLGWTGWISLQSRDSQESSPTPQFKSINSSALSFLYSPTLTSIYDYLKNHSLDSMDLCWQSNISAFQYAV